MLRLFRRRQLFHLPGAASKRCTTFIGRAVAAIAIGPTVIVCLAEATTAAIAALASRCSSAPVIATIVEVTNTGAIATTGASR